MKLLDKINEFLRKFEVAIGAILVLVMFIITLFNITMRYVFNSPLLWADEVILYSFVWAGFFAIAYALSHNNHVSLTMLTSKLSPKVNVVLKVLTNVIIIASFVVMMPSAMRVFKFLLPTLALRIPEEYFYVIIPVSYVVMIYHCFVNAIHSVIEYERSKTS